MTPLGKLIAVSIEADGPMRLDRYMALCLGHPTHGYYATRDPFGARGDFTTSPEISQMFGELIGLWCAEVWSQMGRPPRVRVVELGPGRGTLMADMLRAARAAPGFLNVIEVTLVETSPMLRKIQAQTLGGAGAPTRWCATVEEALASNPSPCKGEGGPARSDGSGGDRPRSSSILSEPHPTPLTRGHPPLCKEREIGLLPAIVIANEFFDALPVRQFVRTSDGWRERLVGLGPEGALRFGLAPEPPADLRLPEAPEGAVREVCADGNAMMRTVSAHVTAYGGAALAIDYGYASGHGDTLQALRAHAFADLLETPGEADLTAHVDFGALAAAAVEGGARPMRLEAQADLLDRLGLSARAEALSRARPDRRGALLAAAARLTDRAPRGMGVLFKALAFGDPRIGQLPGFVAGDRPGPGEQR